MLLLFGLFVIVGVMIYMQRRQSRAAGGPRNQHTSRAQREGAMPDVRFSDVAGDIDHLEIAAAMQGSTVAARRPNLQPLPDPEPDFVAELDDPKQRSRGLWVPGRTGAGAAIAALRAERDADRRGVARA